ncbi:MAG TPA: tetratricopeptide repeat protein [Bryobacteraceae bacterium]|jgi:predicted Zn-dependent protease|nr:tetratricopeptide repeat protein [Bryobacteraceae bacterium]
MSTVSSIPGTVHRRGLPIVRLSVAVAGVIAALFAVDMSLEKTEQGELAAQALRADRNGESLLAQGRAPDAVDAFRKAHALERENVKYELDLIQALMAAGKLQEAQPLMTDILEEQSNDGEANLIAARLAAKEGHIVAADSYYHRAIYGGWPNNVAQHQIQTRLELIEFLTQRGKQNEILAELLPLQEQVAKNAGLQPEVARLFLIAGSPGRAADVFHQLIRAQPKDFTNYAGLGEAELALGDFRAAHNAFANALARNSKNPTLKERLEFANLLSNLDPTVRWLSAQDKYSRTVQILQMASTDLTQCLTNHPQSGNDATTQLLSKAQTALSSSPPKQQVNEVAESNLNLAQQIWRTRVSACGSGAAPDEEALPLIMDKLAQ